MRPLIDYERLRRQTEEGRRQHAEHPEQAKILTRAKIRLVQDYLKEAQVAQFKVLSDEDPPMGTGLAPRPLHYLLVGVGFWLLTSLARSAAVMNVPLDEVEMELRATYPLASEYGLPYPEGSAMERLTYWVDIKSSASAEDIAKLMEATEKTCHATNTLRVPVDVVPVVRLNGHELPFTPPVPPELRNR